MSKGGGESGCGIDDLAEVSVALLCVLVCFDMIDRAFEILSLESYHVQNHNLHVSISYDNMIGFDLKFHDLQVSSV